MRVRTLHVGLRRVRGCGVWVLAVGALLGSPNGRDGAMVTMGGWKIPFKVDTNRAVEF
jgi:hypothetical protein